LHVVSTIGAKEGLAHLMWVLLEGGDGAVSRGQLPDPSRCARLPALPSCTRLHPNLLAGSRRPSAPPWPGSEWSSCRSHDPTTLIATPELMQRLVDLAREREFVLVHDFAYADIAFDGHQPPSVLAAEGALDCAVELYSLTKSFSMAGWRMGFTLGRPDVVAALAKLKSYLDYGTFQPIQIASIVALREAPDYPDEVCEIYLRRRDALVSGLGRAGWEIEPPKGTMFAWAPIPERYAELGSLEFAVMLARGADVAVSPGIGFGPGGDEHVRFALVENEQRIAQATRSIRKLLAE
jgi:alanine-synthesizing transaminase